MTSWASMASPSKLRRIEIGSKARYRRMSLGRVIMAKPEAYQSWVISSQAPGGLKLYTRCHWANGCVDCHYLAMVRFDQGSMASGLLWRVWRLTTPGNQTGVLCLIWRSSFEISWDWGYVFSHSLVGWVHVASSHWYVASRHPGLRIRALGLFRVLAWAAPYVNWTPEQARSDFMFGEGGCLRYAYSDWALNFFYLSIMG